MNRNDQLTQLRRQLLNTGMDDPAPRLRARIRARRRRLATAVMAPVLCCALFISCVNLFPAFAAALFPVPVLGELTRLVNFDKGLTDALDNDYAHLVDQVDDDNGYTMYLPYVIADRQQIVVFYELRGGENLEVGPGDSFDTETGAQLEAAISWGAPSETGRLRSMIYHFTGNPLESGVTLNYELYPKDHAEGEPALAEFSFVIDPAVIYDARVYSPDQTIEVQGQKLTVEQVEIYPTCARILVSQDESNSAWVEDVGLLLTDESGETWGGVNGISATKPDDYHTVYFIQSNYFRPGENLTLQINALWLLPKDKTEIRLDLNARTFSPTDQGIELVSVTRRGDEADVVFRQEDDDHHNPISGVYRDGAGNEYLMDGMNYTTADGGAEYRFSVQWPDDGIVILSRSYGRRTEPPQLIEIPLD